MFKTWTVRIKTHFGVYPNSYKWGLSPGALP